ncbi:hypothetical protein LCGC14_2165380 [marine sediment metagenome]|uniref:Uncharacterized protein n=1 Tax=marine sediment metagenome TaxID=412755 RepID=A0A0F9DRP2_9ZZZZ
MAQVNFMLSDEGDTFTAVNGNTTSAITAGDILYASGSTAVKLGTTVPSGLNYNDVEVEPVKFATAAAQGGSVVGIAEEDAAAGSQVTVRTRGLFFSPAEATTCPLRAGVRVKASDGTTSAGVQRCGTTTRVAAEMKGGFGIALTGTAVDNDYILWLASFGSRG